MPTSAELYARRAALDEAFHLVLDHPNPLSKLNELIAETQTAHNAAVQAETRALRTSQLPVLTDEPTPAYQVAYVVSAV